MSRHRVMESLLQYVLYIDIYFSNWTVLISGFHHSIEDFGDGLDFLLLFL
jgi:hypothetical protein